MAPESEFNELLVSYLLKELDADQERYVAECIKTDNALQQQYLELESLLGILAIEKTVNQIDVSEERLVLQKKIQTLGTDTVQIPPALDSNQNPIVDTRRGFQMQKLLVAVSVILIIVAGSLFFKSNTKRALNLHQNEPAVSAIAATIRHESNFSGKERIISLPDGTIVRLSDQSEIDFPEIFENGKRDIHLTGQAYFKVAKNKRQPFTVHSDDIATTALGTEFTVSNYRQQKTIRVHLFEGKVVIKHVDTSSRESFTPCYLLPGQELLYDRLSAKVKMKGIKSKKLLQQSDGIISNQYDSPSMPSDREGSWFMFNNQSLPDVFDQLSRMYSIKIKYARKDVQKFYFIGKFDRRDSLEYILRNITTINKLMLLKNQYGYIVKK